MPAPKGHRCTYGVWKRNKGILEKDIEKFARWRSIKNTGGKQANLGGTKESNTDIMQMLKTLLLRATKDLY